jgi:hypothetical protein
MIMPRRGSLKTVGYSSSTRRLATVTLAGLGLYLALSVLLYRLRTDCSLLYDPESTYAIGGWSRIMDVAYLVRGGLSAAVLLAFAHGLPPRARSDTGAGVLWIWAVASALLGFFPADPEGRPETASGGVHVVLALAALLAAPLGQILIGYRLGREPAWRPLRPVLLGLPLLAAGAVVLLIRTRYAPHSLDGLWERAFLVCVLGWLLAVALRILTLARALARV